MSTLRYNDGLTYIEASKSEPFPVELPDRNVSLSTKQVSVATTVTLLALANASRRSIKITNITGTAAVYIGAVDVATGSGDYLATGTGSYVVYTNKGAIYALVATTAQTVAVAEESEL